jgi:hypothetical protein
VLETERGYRDKNGGITMAVAFLGVLPKSSAYTESMTKLLEYAVETVRSLPAEIQDDLARTLLQLAGEDQPVIRLNAEERADLAEADAEIARGELATVAEIRALWAKPVS